jgi:hypothetical protein
VIVTTVSLVLTTLPTGIPAFTTASQPLSSACAESSLSMMFCRSASKAAPPGLGRMTIVLTPHDSEPVIVSVPGSSVATAFSRRAEATAPPLLSAAPDSVFTPFV